MRICLACGGPKHVGLLVCWQCHNELQMKHDEGYGPVVEHAIHRAQRHVEARGKDEEC